MQRSLLSVLLVALVAVFIHVSGYPLQNVGLGAVGPVLSEPIKHLNLRPTGGQPQQRKERSPANAPSRKPEQTSQSENPKTRKDGSEPKLKSHLEPPKLGKDASAPKVEPKSQHEQPKLSEDASAPKDRPKSLHEQPKTRKDRSADPHSPVDASEGLGPLIRRPTVKLNPHKFQAFS